VRLLPRTWSNVMIIWLSLSKEFLRHFTAQNRPCTMELVRLKIVVVQGLFNAHTFSLIYRGNTPISINTCSVSSTSTLNAHKMLHSEHYQLLYICDNCHVSMTTKSCVLLIKINILHVVHRYLYRCFIQFHAVGCKM
jgi:hypothetical protein